MSTLVKSHHAGLFSNVNKVIASMELYPDVVVEWQSPECIYGEAKDGNVWQEIFLNYHAIPGEQIERTIVEYPHECYTFKNVADLYRGDPEWRTRLHAQWRKLIVRPEIVTEAKMRAFAVGGKYKQFVTVMIRANSHAGEQVTGKSQSLDDYAKAMNSAMANQTCRACGRLRFYLMCGDWQTCDWMRQRFPVYVNPHVLRSATRDSDRHLQEHQTVEDARTALVEVLTASMGQALIHPVSNMATAALFMNPQLKSVYLP